MLYLRLKVRIKVRVSPVRVRVRVRDEVSYSVPRQKSCSPILPSVLIKSISSFSSMPHGRPQ